MKRLIALLCIFPALTPSIALADSDTSGLGPGGLIQMQDLIPVARPSSPGVNYRVTVGSAADATIGTSGGTVPLLNTANQWSALQTFLSGDLTAADPAFTGGSVLLPSGTTGQRPGSPVNGMVRYNSSTPGIEGYVNGAWGPIGAAGTPSAGAAGALQVVGSTPGTFAAYGGLTCSTHHFLSSMDIYGSSSGCVQPGFSDLSGTASNAQIPTPTTVGLGGILALSAASSHQFVTYTDTSGVQHLAQPQATDVSGLAASATTDTTNASNIASGTLAVGTGGAGSPQTLSISGSAFATNAALGSFFSVTLNGSTITATNPTNPTNGQTLTYELIQDATGTRAVSWGSAFNFGSIGAPTLSTLATKRDIVGFRYSSSASKWLYLGAQYGF